MEEHDLLSLTARGRVKFHAAGEFLCWQSTAYTPFVLVIQQGAVSLWEDANGKESLRDIRGPGDLIGIERYLGEPQYTYSAKAASEVIVYAFHSADFAPLLEKYPQASRYVNAHAGAGAVYQAETRERAHKQFVSEFARHPEPLTCAPDATVAEAARLLRSAHAEAIAVMRGPHLEGMLTTGDILNWIAGSGSPAQSVTALMDAPPPAVAPQTTLSECILAMGRAKSSVAALTSDGSLDGGLLRLITATD